MGGGGKGLMYEITLYTLAGKHLGTYSIPAHEIGEAMSSLSGADCYFTSRYFDLREGGQNVENVVPAASSARPTERPPEQIDAHATVMGDVCGAISLQHFLNLRDLREVSQSFAQMMLEQTRRFTEELAFARTATAKSLESVDLMSRSTTAMMMEQRFAKPAQASVEDGRKNRQGPAIADLISLF
ncbi:MAG: hypothetical protein IPK80_28560 [Nannocystis sp.]|nr:hypothetical protein [Nannocystis sp.]